MGLYGFCNKMQIYLTPLEIYNMVNVVILKWGICCRVSNGVDIWFIYLQNRPLFNMMRLRVTILFLLLLIGGCISSSVSEKKEIPYLLPESKLLKTILRRDRLLKYEYRGQMTPKGIVLHSTSGLKFYETVREIEKRNIAIHILIDGDGTSYKLMGRLDEKGLAVRGLV